MKDKIQAFFVGVFSVLFSWLGVLAIPVLALIGFNLIDYATRLIANKASGVASTIKKSVNVIYKKFGMWVLVASCAIIDFVIMQCGQYVGINLPLKFIIAIIISIWLVFNEFVSILENLRDMGTKVPKFISNLADKSLGVGEDKGQSVVDSIDKGVVKNE